MKNVDDMTDADLHAELHRRNEERKAKAQKAAHADNEIVGTVIGEIGPANFKRLVCVLTEHLKSCDDSNLANAYIEDTMPRCVRCYLLECIKYGTAIDDHLKLVLRFEYRSW